MASSDRKIQARTTTAPSHRWLSRDELPRDLRLGAARRLGITALVAAITFSAFFAMFTPAQAEDQAKAPIAISCTALALVLSLAVFFLSRRRREDPGLLLNLGAIYQILMALIIGVLDNLATVEATSAGQVRGWSGVAVWIFLFAVFVPTTPIRTLWVSSVVALADPLALLGYVAMGAPLPELTLLPKLYGPTIMAVFTAFIAARINHKIGDKLREARELGSYRLLRLLGRGGMGEVWQAEHRMLARPAAIKLISARDGAEEEGRGEVESVQKMTARFEREAQATAMLESEHTIELYDYGVAVDGSFYYVMELLDGLDLEVLVTRNGPMPPRRVVHTLLQVCESLDEAHRRGLVHRDIKPSNIFLCRRAMKYDVVKVLDFGLVKETGRPITDGSENLTAKGAISGTPAYMVPEIINGDDQIDGRADLYALGCVAYFILSGELVFDDDSSMAVLVKHMNTPPVRLSERAQQEIPPGLEEIVHACLEKNPQKRVRSARELMERLLALEQDCPWPQEEARQWWQDHVQDELPTRAGPSEAEEDALLDEPPAKTTLDTVPARPPGVSPDRCRDIE